MATPVPTNVKTQEDLNLVILQFTVVVLYPPVDPMATPQDPAFIRQLAEQAGYQALYWSDGSVQSFTSAGGRYTYTYQCRYATSPFVNIGLQGPQGPGGQQGPQGPQGDPGATGAGMTFHPAVWDQTEWHIDPVNGNDANNGLTLGTALKTVQEYNRRVGTVHEFDRNITMTIHSSLPITDVLNLSGLRQVRGLQFEDKFTVIGVPSAPVATGIATVRNFVQAASIPHGLSCTTLGSLAAYVARGRMVRKTVGTMDVTWLAKDEDGTIARMTFPAHYGAYQESQGTFVTGEAFEIVDLPQVPGLQLPMGQIVHLKNIYFTNYTVINGNQYFYECAFDFVISSMGGFTVFSNCQIHGYVQTYSGMEFYITYGLIKDAVFANEGRASIQNYTILQACTTYAQNYVDEGQNAGISCHTRGFGVYDSPGSALIIAHAYLWYINGAVYGTGNAGYGIEVQRGGKLYTDPSGGVHVVQGALGDIQLGQKTSGPAVNTTNPYAYTEDRAYTYAHLYSSVADGGFGGNIVDPSQPNTAIIIGD